MVRNRLAEFQEKSGVKATDVEEEELKPLKKQDKNPSQEDFLNILQTITSDIDKIKEKGERIEKLQKKILHAVTPNPKEKDELNELNDENKRLAKKIREALKIQQDKNDNTQAEESKLTSRQQTDFRLRVTQVSSQTKRFQEIWTKYNESQLEFRKESKATLVKQAKITGKINLTNEEIEEKIDNGEITGYFGADTLGDIKSEQQKLVDLQVRHGEFMKLEKQIEEVAQLFQEIAALVNSQGEMVDNIYQNVINAEIDVDKAKGELQQAEKSQASARKKKMILAIVLIIVILIVLLVILSEFGAFYSSPEVIYVPQPTTEKPNIVTTTTTEHVTPWNPDTVPETVTQSSY